MKDFNHEISKSKDLVKLNIIRKLKKYKDKEKISLLLDEFNKKQEKDYFLTQSNIRIGKLITTNKKFNDKKKKYFSIFSCRPAWIIF